MVLMMIVQSFSLITNDPYPLFLYSSDSKPNIFQLWANVDVRRGHLCLRETLDQHFSAFSTDDRFIAEIIDRLFDRGSNR